MLAGMTTTTPESRGQLAYTAYCKTVGFTAYNGETLKTWIEVPEDRRAGWVAAAGLIWDLATTGTAEL